MAPDSTARSYNHAPTTSLPEFACPLTIIASARPTAPRRAPHTLTTHLCGGVPTLEIRLHQACFDDDDLVDYLPLPIKLVTVHGGDPEQRIR